MEAHDETNRVQGRRCLKHSKSKWDMLRRRPPAGRARACPTSCACAMYPLSCGRSYALRPRRPLSSQVWCLLFFGLLISLPGLYVPPPLTCLFYTWSLPVSIVTASTLLQFALFAGAVMCLGRRDQGICTLCKQYCRRLTCSPGCAAASVDNPAYKDNTGAANVKSFLMTDGGVIANDPAGELALLAHVAS